MIPYSHSLSHPPGPPQPAGHPSLVVASGSEPYVPPNHNLSCHNTSLNQRQHCHSVEAAFESSPTQRNAPPSGYVMGGPRSDAYTTLYLAMSPSDLHPQVGLQHLDGGLQTADSTSPPSSRDHGARAKDDEAQNEAPENGGGLEHAGDSHGQIQEPDKQNSRPWSELKTKAGKERKRLPLACIACRRKKIRCSGEKPACKHCFRSRIPCVYKVTTRKATPRTDYMAMLDKRLKRMEERVIKIIPKDERDMVGIGRAVLKPPVSGQTPRAPRQIHKKRSADEAFSAEMKEWTRQQHKSPSRDGAPLSLQARVVEENKLMNEGAEFLPPAEIQEHLAEVFFDCVYGQSYLLLHKPSFMRRLKTGTVPPVLILAVCAVAARFSTHPQVSSEPPFLRGEQWANPAATIALRRHDEPSITILTVFLILGLHEFGACHGGRSWSFGGQALRMAYALQLHREVDHDRLGQNNKASELSFTDREIRRRTMWACFLMDRYNSSGSQRPPIGNEKFLQIQLPIKESHFQMEIPGPTEDLDGSVPNPVPEGLGQLTNPKENMGVSAYIIRGIVLWGRLVDYFNLGGKEKDTHRLWDKESGYVRLKKQLDDFSASLPNSLAFTLENLRNHDAEKIANQFLFLHIIIHQNILFLNRFAIPLSPGGRPPKDIPNNFLRDAGRAAVEAAGQISMLINQASGYLLTVPFAGYCSYAASTVHIWGIFSKNAQLEAKSTENLRHTFTYLNKMKRYWGMFHYMVESAKDRYRHFAEAAIKGTTPDHGGQDSPMFQYGDWFDKYPHGVSRSHWQNSDTAAKRDASGDTIMGQHYDLQSVEDFFASLSPPSRADMPRKEARRQANLAADTMGPVLRTSNPASSYESLVPEQPPPPPPSQPQSMIDMAMTNAQPGVAGTPDLSFSAFNNPALFPQPRTQSFGPALYPFQANPDQLHQIDRQLVYGAYAGIDPMVNASALAVPMTSSTANADAGTDPGTSNPDAGLWQVPFDMGTAPVWTGEFLQPGAWFIPFNLDPVGGGVDMPTAAAAQPGPGSGMGVGSSLAEGAYRNPNTALDSFNVGLETGNAPVGSHDANHQNE